jgi:hypothetical protein
LRRNTKSISFIASVYLCLPSLPLLFTGFTGQLTNYSGCIRNKTEIMNQEQAIVNEAQCQKNALMLSV